MHWHKHRYARGSGALWCACCCGCTCCQHVLSEGCLFFAIIIPFPQARMYIRTHAPAQTFMCMQQWGRNAWNLFLLFLSSYLGELSCKEIRRHCLCIEPPASSAACLCASTSDRFGRRHCVRGWIIRCYCGRKYFIILHLHYLLVAFVFFLLHFF